MGELASLALARLKREGSQQPGGSPSSSTPAEDPIRIAAREAREALKRGDDEAFDTAFINALKLAQER